MDEAQRSNRPTPRTPAAVEAELRRRIRSELAQAREDADGELDDAALAGIIGRAIAAALGWHLESPDHTRNATLSSRAWRGAGGPRGGPPRDFEPRPGPERGPRQFGPTRDRNGPPGRGPRQFGQRDFEPPPRRGPPPFGPPDDFDFADDDEREMRDFDDRPRRAGPRRPSGPGGPRGPRGSQGPGGPRGPAGSRGPRGSGGPRGKRSGGGGFGPRRPR